jgi:hypothetical protein
LELRCKSYRRPGGLLANPLLRNFDNYESRNYKLYTIYIWMLIT